MKISVHRKLQYDLECKPLICVHANSEQGGRRVFCLWRWGIQIGSWSWSRGFNQVAFDADWDAKWRAARKAEEEARAAAFNAEHAEQGARCSAAYEAEMAKRAALWRAGFRPERKRSHLDESQRSATLAERLNDAKEARTFVVCSRDRLPWHPVVCSHCGGAIPPERRMTCSDACAQELLRLMARAPA